MENTLKIVPLVLMAILAAVTALDPPSNWRICDRSLPDETYYECINDAVANAVMSLAGGMKQLKILPVDPLSVDSMKFDDSQGSVKLRQEYRNIKVYGLATNLKIKNYNIDWNKCLLSSESLNAQVEFVADYKIDGKVLVLPIRGSGKSNITMYDLQSMNTIYCEKYQKDGETYLKIKKYDVKFNPNRVTLKFDNLFDGDNVLGEQMNRFINDNSDLLFQDLKSSYEQSFGLVFTKISNDVFSRIPLKKLFPSA